MIDRGFSGGAIYSETLEAVVAIQIEAGKARLGPTNKTVLAMPLYRIARYWDPLSDLVEKPKPNSEHTDSMFKVLDALSWAIRTLIAQ